MYDTIFALSSGAPPAAIAVIRISGPRAGAALRSLVRTLPPPRSPKVRTLRGEDGGVLDRALVLWLPGQGNATGEDSAEIHAHGGRAVVAAILAALAAVPGLRQAEPGEFTRRAFANGRIDLAEAEGLADLLAAETELQRSAAAAMAGGAFSRTVEEWRAQLLAISAHVETALDFSDDDDTGQGAEAISAAISGLREALELQLVRPAAETLREGIRVVLAGPPNTGKSTLFNVLVENEAAITAPEAGTTRDVLMRPIALDGVPFTVFDTAGLRMGSTDAIERIGIERAGQAVAAADIVLWLGEEGAGPPGAWEIAPKSDRLGSTKQAHRHAVSAKTGAGLDALRGDLVATARTMLPRPGEAALGQRQRGLLRDAARALGEGASMIDPLLVAEALRRARVAFDGLLGRTTTEDMLDTLFGRFCIGK